MSELSAPTRAPAPPRGSLRTLLAMRRDPVGCLEAFAAQGDAVPFQVGPTRVVLFNHPDAIHEVLVARTRDFTKGRALQQAKRLVGEGILTSEGDVHREHRRILQPAFHHDRIAAYGQAMVRRAASASASWRHGQTLDVLPEMGRITLGVVGETLFGADLEGEAARVGPALLDAMEALNRFTIPLPGVLGEVPTPRHRRFLRAKATLDEVTYALIAQRRRSGEDRGDVLSMLLHAQDEGGGRMTDEQVRDEAITLLLAGHETTAVALTWTFYLLGQNPDAEQALHAELDAVLGDRPPEARDMPRLEVARQVLSESMRLFPPAWVLGRLAAVDTRIAGMHVPRGSSVLVSQWLAHRDARWWREPGRFRLDRWSHTEEAKRPRWSYFPFGGGPRLCIGEAFAWMEGTLVLATLAQRWRMRHAPGHAVALQPLITLRPRHGMVMTLEARRPGAGIEP